MSRRLRVFFCLSAITCAAPLHAQDKSRSSRFSPASGVAQTLIHVGSFARIGKRQCMLSTVGNRRKIGADVRLTKSSALFPIICCAQRSHTPPAGVTAGKEDEAARGTPLRRRRGRSRLGAVWPFRCVA